MEGCFIRGTVRSSACRNARCLG